MTDENFFPLRTLSAEEAEIGDYPDAPTLTDERIAFNPLVKTHVLKSELRFEYLNGEMQVIPLPHPTKSLKGLPY